MGANRSIHRDCPRNPFDTPACVGSGRSILACISAGFTSKCWANLRFQRGRAL